jgi:stringent starvation protein B
MKILINDLENYKLSFTAEMQAIKSGISIPKLNVYSREHSSPTMFERQSIIPAVKFNEFTNSGINYSTDFKQQQQNWRRTVKRDFSFIAWKE